MFPVTEAGAFLKTFQAKVVFPDWKKNVIYLFIFKSLDDGQSLVFHVDDVPRALGSWAHHLIPSVR